MVEAKAERPLEMLVSDNAIAKARVRRQRGWV